MTVARIALESVMLLAGVGLMLGRRRIGDRHRGHGSRQTAAPILWLFFGTLIAMNGLLQVLLPLA